MVAGAPLPKKTTPASADREKAADTATKPDSNAFATNKDIPIFIICPFA